jgi:hypothetical protein
MTESDLTPNLKALLTFIMAHAAEIIPEHGTFDPYGILLRRTSDGVEMVFIETHDDSDETLKGLPAKQMLRNIEDSIRIYRRDLAVESAAIVSDAYFRPIEGGDEGNGLRIWLDDRGKQSVHVTISYEVTDGTFVSQEKSFLPKDRLFLPSRDELP